MGQAGPPKPWSRLQRKSSRPTQQPLYSAAATSMREIALYGMIRTGVYHSLETAGNTKYPTMFPCVKASPVYNSQKMKPVDGGYLSTPGTCVLPATCLMHRLVQIGLAYFPVQSQFVPSAFQEELSSASPCLSQQIAMFCASPQETDGEERRGRHLRRTVAVSEGAGCDRLVEERAV